MTRLEQLAGNYGLYTEQKEAVSRERYRVVLKKDPQDLAGAEMEVKQLDSYCGSK